MQTEHEYEHNGHKYWVTLEPTTQKGTGKTGYKAYVSDKKPTDSKIGLPVKDEHGQVMFFTSKFSALSNANAIKQSELNT